MRFDRLVAILIGLTVCLQLTTLYKQTARARPQEPTRSVPGGTVIDVSGMAARGNPEAPIVMVEFSDYECPFCVKHTNTVGVELKRTYVDTGIVRHVFANNPLPIHSQAPQLAASALCAGRNDRFWEMHDALFASAGKAPQEAPTIAMKLGIDAAKFEQCVNDDGLMKAEIRKEASIAQSLGVSGTPAFAIGVRQNDGRVAIKIIVSGAQPLTVFDEAIESIKQRIAAKL